MNIERPAQIIAAILILIFCYLPFYLRHRKKVIQPRINDKELWDRVEETGLPPSVVVRMGRKI